MEQLLVYRMEDTHHHGPFNPAIAAHNLFGALEMWSHVPWADVRFGGLSAFDDTHPHHIVDVLGLDDEAAYEAEYEHHLPIAGKWLVGCKDLQQLYHWFPPESLPDFAICGMRLHVYSCPVYAVKLGTWQLMFDPKCAELVKTLSLTLPLKEAA